MSQLPNLLLSLSLLLATPPGDHARQDPEPPPPKLLGTGDAVTIQIGDGATFHGLLQAPLRGAWVHLRGDDGARMAFPRETIRWVREGR